MATRKHLLVLAISLLAMAAALGRELPLSQQSEKRKCEVDRLTASKPSRRIESEAGLTELFEENPEQFQCAGVQAMRNIMKPNSLALPNYHPSPRLVYIEKGRGWVGLSYPGCPESYTSDPAEARKGRRDHHQRVHRVERGDIVVLPPGTTYYAVNDGDEDLVAVSIDDLNNQANQLDPLFRAFYLAGSVGVDQKGAAERRTFESVLRNFDEELLAEAFGVNREIIKRVQKRDNRGPIVSLKEGTAWIIPPEEEGGRSTPRNHHQEETEMDIQDPFCSARITQNIDREKDAYIYSRSAGSLTIASQRTLPTLRWVGLSAERLRLNPNALLAPQYEMRSHSIVYVTKGEARAQVADQRGRTVLDQTVREGEMYVVPQMMVLALKAGSQGYEAVVFKTTATPATSALAGQGSAFEGMPLDVIANSYQISSEDAQKLKSNRHHEKWLLAGHRPSATAAL